MRWLVVASGLALLATLRPEGVPLRAQTAGLDAVEEWIVRGRTTDARRALETWWESDREGASPEERQRGLWMRAKLTVDPSLARIDYTRLVMEHPGGPYSADALLRLGRAAEAQGRPSEAARHFDQLLRDYPESPHRLEARRWLDGNRGALLRGPAVSEAGAPDPPSAGGATDGAAEPAANGTVGTGEEPESGAVFAVQLGAFSTAERARALLERVRERGIDDLRVVRIPGSELVRVRAGRFDRREEAAARRERLRALGMEAAVVDDANREEEMP